MTDADYLRAFEFSAELAGRCRFTMYACRTCGEHPVICVEEPLGQRVEERQEIPRESLEEALGYLMAVADETINSPASRWPVAGWQLAAAVLAYRTELRELVPLGGAATLN